MKECESVCVGVNVCQCVYNVCERGFVLVCVYKCVRVNVSESECVSGCVNICV